MKHIKITTHIPDKSPAEVWENFDRELLDKLNPPWVSAKLLRYDGNNPGDEVHLQLNFILFKQNWISIITDNNSSEGHYEFIDKGRQLPFFLKSWKHRHVITAYNNGTNIVDDIHFSTSNLISDLLLYPVLYLQFWYRKPVYRKVFK